MKYVSFVAASSSYPSTDEGTPVGSNLFFIYLKKKKRISTNKI